MMENNKAEARKKYGTWAHEKYYVTKGTYSGLQKLFISVGLLIRWFGVSEKTLRNGISKFMNGRSTNYRSFIDSNAIMVDYDTLPSNAKAKRKLPKRSQEAIALLKAEKEQQEEINKDFELKSLKDSFEDMFKNRWPQFLKFYEEKIADIAERNLYAQSHALLFGVLESVRNKWPKKIIFEAVRQLMMEELDEEREPVFYTFSPIYFWRKVSVARRWGIEKALIHDMRGVPRQYQVKMTGPIKAFARLEFRKPKRLTVKAIIDRIWKRFGVSLSETSIKNLKRKSIDRNILEYDSDGRVWSRQNGLPKITRFLAMAPGDQYQGDWYKLQFYCLCDTTRKVIRLWAYIVLDVFSKKMVGWSLSERPLAAQAKEAFKMAFVDHCMLPEEVIIDNDKIYERKIFKRFIRRINNIGVITTKAYPNIPTWKAEIESAFSVFQKLHAAKPFYIGEGVRSKNIAGNPSPELVKKIYKDRKNMPSVSQMRIEFATMVNEYNAMTNNRKKKIAPQDTFLRTKPKHAQKFEEWMLPLLFWQAKTKKRIKNDGRIDLQLEGKEYCYQVTKAELLWTHKNTDVRMCYNPDDLSKIYIFERGTLKYIGMIEPRLVMDRNNKDEVLKKQNRILREAQQFLKDARKADEAMLKGLPMRQPIHRESLNDKILRIKSRQRRFEQEVSDVKIDD